MNPAALVRFAYEKGSMRAGDLDAAICGHNPYGRAAAIDIGTYLHRLPAVLAAVVTVGIQPGDIAAKTAIDRTGLDMCGIARGHQQPDAAIGGRHIQPSTVPRAA